MNNYNYKNKIINKITSSFSNDNILNIIITLIFCILALSVLTFKYKKKEIQGYMVNNNKIIKKKLNYILNSSINELKKKNS